MKTRTSSSPKSRNAPADRATNRLQAARQQMEDALEKLEQTETKAVPTVRR